MIKSVMPALALALLAGAAHADGDYASPTDDRVRVTLGAMHVSTATTLRVDSSTGVPGTTVAGEDQFGLDPSDFEPKFQIMFREGERNRLWLDYFTLDRTGSTVVEEPIVFRDVVIQPGDPLQSELDLRLLTLTYGYSFWHSEKVELAATLGVSAVQIQATAKVATDAVHLDQIEDEAGPFATPGIAATWAVSKRFYFDGRRAVPESARQGSRRFPRDGGARRALPVPAQRFFRPGLYGSEGAPRIGQDRQFGIVRHQQQRAGVLRQGRVLGTGS